MMRMQLKKRIGLFLALLFILPAFACQRVEVLFASAPKDAVIINEVVTSNQLSLQDEIYGSPDWIELYNGSRETVSLKNYYLTDNTDAPQKACQLPDRELAPGEFLVLYANKKGEGENSVDFSLKKSGEVLTLLDAHTEEISTLVVPALIRDVSYARRADGTYGFSDLPTPGADNGENIVDELPLTSQLVKEEEEPPEEVVEEVPPPSPPILFTEIVSRNKASLAVDGCTGCTDWVELFNPNEVEVSMEGFTFTDDPSETEKHNLPPFVLSPGQRVILCSGPGTCIAEGHVRVDVSLSSEGEEVYLFDSNAYLLDQVPFPALSPDVSWAKRSSGSWGYCLLPTPGEGGIDEQIVDDLSPKPMQDQLLSLHIHEVLYRNTQSILDEDGDRSDFVELFNAGSEPVSLTGWYLSDSPDNLDKWALPDVSVAPGEYLLVFLSGKDRKAGELHASFSLHAGETLTLYDNHSRTYDALQIPETEKNVSIGRDASGAIVFYSYPTPLQENGYPLSAGK